MKNTLPSNSDSNSTQIRLKLKKSNWSCTKFCTPIAIDRFVVPIYDERANSRSTSSPIHYT
ncbi:hypothetical protein BLOT_011211 [Blomia tropicalis]|nr:hypothetical protein BLOT_011211 [Blomia tropicalis]